MSAVAAPQWVAVPAAMSLLEQLRDASTAFCIDGAQLEGGGIGGEARRPHVMLGHRDYPGWMFTLVFGEQTVNWFSAPSA